MLSVNRLSRRSSEEVHPQHKRLNFGGQSVAAFLSSRRAIWLHAAAAFAFGAALAAGSAKAATLGASYELNTPPAISEVEDEVRTQDGSPASISRTIDDTSAADGEPNWRVSASATSTFATQKTRARWFDGGTFDSATAKAEATVDDVFTIGGDGDGILRMTYDLSGSIEASEVRPEFRGDALYELLTDFGIFFSAELSRGFSRTRVSEEVELSRGEGPGGDEGFFFFGWFEAFPGGFQAVLERAVSAGDILDYSVFAQALISTQNARGSARANFGTTAQLSSVFLSDGLSLIAESGFDYFSVNQTDSGGDGPVGVPVPASAILLAFGFVSLAVQGRRRRGSH